MSSVSGSQKWPLSGTRKAKVGPTIKNSFKKKSAGPAAGPGKLGRDLYAVRYNFIPQEVDMQKPATLDITPYKDDHGSVAKVVLERPIANKDDVFVFEGVERPMQSEYDCVLIWDESLQTLTLEKVESQLNLTHMGQRPPTKRVSSNSPAATPEASGSTSAIGSPVKQEADDSEEDVPIVKAAPPAKRPMPFQPKPKPKPTAVTPLQTSSSASPSVPSPVSTKPKARPSKRADPGPVSPKRPRTPPKPFGGLQLPTSSSVDLAFPMASAPATFTKSEPTPAAFVPPVRPVEDEDEEEDDMVEVEPGASTYTPSAHDVPTPTLEPSVAEPRGFSETFVMEEVEDDDDMEEVGLDDAMEDVRDNAMEEVVGDDEDGFDFLAANLGGDDDDDDDDDLEQVALDSGPPILPEDGPISLNAYAGGGGAEEDDYSSSDESD